MDIRVDVARENELDRLLEIHLAAFPDGRDLEARRRNFTTHPRASFDRLYVARDKATDVPLGHAFLHSVTLGFGGARVPVGGVASVGVAPEARGRGVAGQLLGHLHEVSRQKGHALTVLYAFRQGFYARHGYVQTRSAKRLFVKPSAFRVFDGAGHSTSIHAAKGDDRSAIEALHARQTDRGTGWELRSTAFWDLLFLDERRSVFVAKRNNVTCGYLASTLRQTEPHAASRLRVHELVAEDDASRRALYAHLGRQRDQVEEVEIPVAEDDPLELALIDSDGARYGTEDLEHPLGTIAGGPMLRLHDPALALAARGYFGGDSELTMFVDDRRLRLRVVQGRGMVSEMAPDEREADVRMNIRTLGAIAFGGWSARAVWTLGQIEGEASAIERAAQIFAMPAYFSVDPF